LLTWSASLCCTIFGLLYGWLKSEKPNPISAKEQGLLGLLYTLNYLPTNYSLLFISYPMQAIGKNLRYLLVVIVGVFFTRVKKGK
jgi:hypothetical protein